MQKPKTNFSDWSQLIPVQPESGPRTQALHLELRRLIESGKLSAGDKLPPSRELAARLGVARGAVVAAYEQLMADGYVQGRMGAGTYVADTIPRVRVPVRAPKTAAPSPALLPGKMGSAMVDTRTMDTFRKLLSRHLLRASDDHFHYTESRGNAQLREAVASYLRTARAVRVHADQVIITSGMQQALDLVLRAALKPGDKVWMEDPGYLMARVALQENGLHIVPVPVDAEGLRSDVGINRAPDARAVYVTPSHQFPLGVTMSMKRRVALLEWAKASKAWILEDDYDSEFRYAGPPFSSLQGMDGADRVVYLGTFSKALFPGLRTGYMVVPEALLDRVMEVRNRTDRFSSTVVAGPLADLLDQGHFASHLRRARKHALQNRDALVRSLGKSGLQVQVPDQGLHLIARLPSGVSEEQAVQQLMRAGLEARPLSSLYLTAKKEKGLVIGFSGFTPKQFADAGNRYARMLGR